DMPLSHERVAAFEQQLKLMRGEYLEAFQFDWVEYERRRYRSQWIRLNLKLARWYYEQQQLEKAFQICDQVCIRAPMEEQAQLMYLKICDKLGYDFLVQKQFQMYKTLLERELSENPGAEIT